MLAWTSAFTSKCPTRVRIDGRGDYTHTPPGSSAWAETLPSTCGDKRSSANCLKTTTSIDSILCKHSKGMLCSFGRRTSCPLPTRTSMTLPTWPPSFSPKLTRFVVHRRPLSGVFLTVRLKLHSVCQALIQGSTSPEQARLEAEVSYVLDSLFVLEEREAFLRRRFSEINPLLQILALPNVSLLDIRCSHLTRAHRIVSHYSPTNSKSLSTQTATHASTNFPMSSIS